jgi:hypothetical protein
MNPDKYIRKAYIDGLSLLTGLPAYHKRLPVDIYPLPSMYILITTQTKNESGTKGKQLSTSLSAFRLTEWMCSITIEIIRVNERSFGSYASVEDVEEQIIDWVRTQLQVPEFYVKETELVDSISLDIDTDTVSMDRKVLTFQHWVNER